MEKFRRRTLEIKLRVTVDEYIGTVPHSEESYYKFHWEENHCIENELKNFTQLLKRNDEESCCTCCGYSDIKMLPLGSHEGIDLTTKTKKPEQE